MLPLRGLFVVKTGGGCYWHLVGRDQGCCYTPYKGQDSAHNKEPNISIVPKLRNLTLTNILPSIRRWDVFQVLLNLTFHKPVWHLSVLKLTDRIVWLFHRQQLLQNRLRLAPDSSVLTRERQTGLYINNALCSFPLHGRHWPGECLTRATNSVRKSGGNARFSSLRAKEC